MSKKLDYEHRPSPYPFLAFPMQLPGLFKQSVRLVVGICLMVLLWLTWIPVATAITVQDVPNPRRISGGWVTDMADLLSPEDETQMNQIATELEADTQAELAVVTVPTTAPAVSPKAFATKLFNTWGIGKADQDNGLLILISRDDRRVEIETGRGMATILSDDQVAQLLQTVLVPSFRQEDYAGGMIQATQQLADEIRSQSDRVRQFVIPTVIWELMGVGIVGLLGICGLLRWRSRQPTPLKMGEQQLRRDVLQEVSIFRENEVKTWFGEHPPRKLTSLFLAPTLLTTAATLYSLAFIVLTATRYWGGSLFGFSLLIPILSALLIFGYFLMLLFVWLIENAKLIVAPVALLLTLLVVWIPALGLNGFPYRNFWVWIQRPEQAAGLVVAFSIPLSRKLLKEFEWDGLRYRRQHQAFCCDRHYTALNFLQPEQLEPLLTTEQQTSLAARDIKICGWHCPACDTAINRDSTHLQIARISRPSPSSDSETSGRSRTSSRQDSSSSSAYDSYYYPDTSSSSSSSDFGGGSSDGGGSGSDW